MRKILLGILAVVAVVLLLFSVGYLVMMGIEFVGGKRIDSLKSLQLNRRQTEAIVEGFALAQTAETPARAAQLVREYGLPREALLTFEGRPEAAAWRRTGTRTRSRSSSRSSAARRSTTAASAPRSARSRFPGRSSRSRSRSCARAARSPPSRC